jgi:hypothetical protein
VGRGRQRRAIGTAYLEVAAGSTAAPWYSFGPQLAQFVDVAAQRDAFALLLEGSTDARQKYLESRGISDDALNDVRTRLSRRMAADDGVFEEVLEHLEGWPVAEEQGEAELPPQTDPESEQHSVEAGAQELPEEVPDPTDDAEIELAPIDASLVEIEEAPHEQVPPIKSQAGRSRGTGFQSGPINWDHVTKLARSIGRWGEELVFKKEQTRLTGLDFDTSAVEWRSARDEHSPFDIKSLDRDGHIIFIEVKSTTQIDPHTPFDISAGELIHALRNRERYYIYRVLGAGTDTPRIIIYDDPIGRLLSGEGEMKLGSARLYLAPPAGVQ